MTPLRIFEAGPGAPRFVFAHGAGAGSSHPWMVRMASGLHARGITVVTFDFDYVTAGSKLPDKSSALEARYREVVAQVTLGGGQNAVAIGGKSMGGRIASHIAAECIELVRCLVFFGYPLHPPGKPDKRRDAHLTGIKAPMLFIQGARDPFGDASEISQLADGLGARVHIVASADHGLQVSKRSGLDADEVRGEALDAAATFIADQLGR